jgi:type I restriction enzyme S subunit
MMVKQRAKAAMPRLRFPEFRTMAAWREVPLERVAQRTSTKNSDGHVTRVLTNSAEFGVLDQRDYFDKDIATAGKVDGYYVVGKGDYVYNPRTSAIAPVGPISRNNVGEGVMSPLYTVFRFSEDKTDFYEHYFRSSGWHSYLRSAASTGARHDRMSITTSAFMRMPVPVPSREEQQKIADCLTSLDEVIAAQGRKVEALKAHKRGLMQQLFPREGETRPRLRFPEFRDAPEWEIKPLLGVAENLDNKRVPITEGKRTKGEIPYYGASGIVDYVEGHIFDEDLLCISEDGANLVARTYPIAFPISGRTWVNNHAHVLRFDNLATQKIVEDYLNSTDLRDFITGMAQPKLNRSMLDTIPIPLPEPDEQQRIADCLASLDAQITAESNQLAALKTHKQGLMQQLFPAPEPDQ